MRPVTSPSDCVLDGRVHSTSDAKRFSREEGKKQNVHELLKQEDRHGPKHKRKGLSPTGLQFLNKVCGQYLIGKAELVDNIQAVK